MEDKQQHYLKEQLKLQNSVSNAPAKSSLPTVQFSQPTTPVSHQTPRVGALESGRKRLPSSILSTPIGATGGGSQLRRPIDQLGSALKSKSGDHQKREGGDGLVTANGTSKKGKERERRAHG